MVTSLYHIVYCSAARTHFGDAELMELLEVARANNASLGVTGMLLYDEGSFIQVLEGPRDVVEGLFQRIEADPRHTEARILARGEIAERSFGEWSMGFHRVGSGGPLPKGFNRFLLAGPRRADRASTARGALSAFRDGRWRERAEDADGPPTGGTD